MLSRRVLTLFLGLLWSCSGSSSPASDPGPLVDNTQWVPSTAGDDIFGPPPPDADCDLTPIDCEDEYPWPEGGCVEFDPTSSCVAAVIPECLDSFTVLAIYTRTKGDTVNLCNWITLEQPSLRPIYAGDQVEVRARHSALTAPAPNGEAQMIFVIGDEIVLDYSTSIPSNFQFPKNTWTAPKDYPAGTPLLWHVDNHGSNEYMLIEVNILKPQ